MKLADKYNEALSTREAFVSRAKFYSELTIKYLYEERKNGESASKAPGYTSLGGKAVNHLANKVVQTVFPIGHAYFAPKPTDETAKALEQEGYTEATLSQHFAELAKKCSADLPDILDRQTMVETVKHLIVGGNVALYYPSKKRAILIPLTNYTCKRDNDGTVVQFIWKQTKAFGRLSKRNQEAYIRSSQGNQVPRAKDKIDLYSGVELLPDGGYDLIEEIRGVQTLREKISFEDLPFDVLRWSKVTGEDYGHSHVEDNASDLFAHGFLTKCKAKGMALMCDVKFLVRGGMTDINALVKSEIGAYVPGDMDDIGVLQIGRFADYTQVSETIEAYRREIGQAFLMNSAIRRDAERVTTYELRLDAAELESANGGIYSLLAESWQAPLARRQVIRKDSRFRGALKFTVVTGVESLGKATELDKIMQFGQMMQIPAAWPEGVQQRVKWGDFTAVVAASLNMSLPWLMNDKEFQQMQEAQAQDQQEQTMQQGVADGIPGAMQQMASAATK